MSKQAKTVVLLICSIILFVFAKVDDPPVKAQTNTGFMTAPYFGTKPVSVVFDHEYPLYRSEIDPPYYGDPTTILHNDGNYYPHRGICVGYSGHPGIDYPMSHDYVLAAHDGQVFAAGWQDPQNRRLHLGLHVEIDVTLSNGNSYKTRYGHLSTLLVEVGQQVSQKAVVAISGNTGNSSGPHLHFEVQKFHNNFFRPVNPYGWHGKGVDPWEAQGGPISINLWQDENPPSITPYSTCGVLMYPSGAVVPPSDAPLLTPDLSNSPVFVIDDNDARFSTLGGPWLLEWCADLPACYGNTYRYMTLTSFGGFAMWTPESYDLVTGQYDVYASIPNAHANTVLAYYQIYHNNKLHTAGIDQSRFNQGTYTRNWAYLGRYDYNNSASINPQRVLVTHMGDQGQHLAADAIAFVLANGRPPDLYIPISQGSDDAGRDSSCGFWTGSSEIYLGYCNNGITGIVSGFRYSNIDIPAGATIIWAYLEFTLDGPYEVPLQLRFHGHNDPNSPTFSNNDRPENRLPLTKGIAWNIPAADKWSFNFPKRLSPNLAPIVQELVRHPNWSQGQSALTFIVKPAFSGSDLSGNYHRRVMAYERGPTPGHYSARLLVWYEE